MNINYFVDKYDIFHDISNNSGDDIDFFITRVSEDNILGILFLMPFYSTQQDSITNDYKNMLGGITNYTVLIHNDQDFINRVNEHAQFHKGITDSICNSISDPICLELYIQNNKVICEVINDFSNRQLPTTNNIQIEKKDFAYPVETKKMTTLYTVEITDNQNCLSSIKKNTDFLEGILSHYPVLEYDNCNCYMYYYYQNNNYNSSRDKKHGNGGLFLVTNHKLNSEELIYYKIANSLLANKITITKHTKLLRQESIKSAISAIMSRNMSHNLGSHVITNTRYQIENLSKNFDQSVQKQLNGVTALLEYLQERQDFVAVIANEDQYAKGPLNFKTAVFDMLAMDGPAKRHNGNNTDRQIHNYVLDNIVRSEEIYRDDDIAEIEKGTYPIEIQMVKVGDNGELLKDTDGKELNFKSNPTESEKKDKQPDSSNFTDIQLAVPYGLNGRQAFLVILENIIRNAAKHNKKDLKSDLTFSIIIKETDKNYEITIADNKQNYDKVIEKFKEKDNEPDDKKILNSKGELKKLNILNKDAVGGIDRNNKGIKEILIALSWLTSKDGKAEYHKIEDEDGYNNHLLKIVGVDENFNVTNEGTNLSLGFKFEIDKYLEFYEVTDSEITELKKQQNNDTEFSKELAKLTSAFIYVFPTNTEYNLLEKVKKHLTRVVRVNLEKTSNYADKKQSIQTAYKAIFTESYSEIPKLVVLEKKENIEGKNYKDCTNVERKAISEIDADSNSSMPLLDKEHILFYNHYDDRLKDNVSQEKMQIEENCRFVEGLSGGNFTQNLIRTSINEWSYLKIVEASLAKIAIVDERIFKKYKGVTISERKNELLEAYKSPITKLIDNFIQQIKDLSDTATYNSIWRTLCNEQSFLLTDKSQLSDETINKLSKYKNDKEKTYHILTDCIYFTANEMGNPEYNKFKDYLEHKNIYILNSDTNGNLITLDRKFFKNSEIKDIDFDFMSIHLGLFDKMNLDKFEEKFNTIKTRNNISENTKITIHSGRGGLPNIENKPFIPFSGIDWSLDNCKYVLAELFYGIKY